MTYEKVKYYYDKKLWSVERVRNAVVMGVVTEEQFFDIAGQTYQ